MNFILSQLIVGTLFLFLWKLNELSSNQNTYMKLLKEEVPKAAKLRN